MSDLYDLFKPKEPPASQAFDKEAWAEKKKAEKSRCYAMIDASLERIGQDPALFEGYHKVQSKGPWPPSWQTATPGRSRASWSRSLSTKTPS